MTAPHTPRLCIGLPVYNGDNYLAQTIESLLGQTFAAFRLVISDNASTDGTEAICRAYAGRDTRIDYRRAAENRGAAWNFNHLCALADTEYFKWAAHDDLHAPTFLERCIAALDAQPRAIACYPDAYVIDEHGTIVTAYRGARAAAAQPWARFNIVARKPGLCHMTFGVFRVAALRRTQLHGAYPGSDLVLLAELALRGEIVEVDEPLFLLRDHPQRASRACGSNAALVTWFDPHSTPRVHLFYWTLLANYLRTLARVPIPATQKLLCALVMARWTLGRSRYLRGELALAAAARTNGLAAWARSARRRHPTARVP